MWDHRPDADALLADRLAGGWQPTPSGFKDGARVVGHACRVPRVAG